MEKKDLLKDLKGTIILLEAQRLSEGILLKEYVVLAYKSLNPVNLLKKTIGQIMTAPILKQDLLAKAMGLAAGYISKKILVGKTQNPVKNLLGSFLQLTAANSVSANSGVIRSLVTHLVKNLINSKNKSS